MSDLGCNSPRPSDIVLLSQQPIAVCRTNSNQFAMQEQYVIPALKFNSFELFLFLTLSLSKQMCIQWHQALDEQEFTIHADIQTGRQTLKTKLQLKRLGSTLQQLQTCWLRQPLFLGACRETSRLWEGRAVLAL